MKEIEILIASRDRATEIALCIQSLLNQTYKDWSLILLDDASGTNLMSFHFIQKIINQCKLEGHRVIMLRNEISNGVCFARNILQKTYLERSKAPYSCRIDDDVILDQNYLKRLIKVIESGYDIASGITPPYGMPQTKRETRFVKPIINEHKLDDEGNIILRKDECGMLYIDDAIVPTHQFRSNALMKREIVEKVNYPENLTFIGFREELWYSFKAIIEGFKIGVDTGAVAWHCQANSGGTKSSPNYMFDVQLDEETSSKWVKKMFKEHGNFLRCATQ